MKSMWQCGRTEEQRLEGYLVLFYTGRLKLAGD